VKAHHNNPDIKRHADGSIDYGHYDRRARQIRGDDFAGFFRAVRARLVERWARRYRSAEAEANAMISSQARFQAGSSTIAKWLRLSTVRSSARPIASARRTPSANG